MSARSYSMALDAIPPQGYLLVSRGLQALGVPIVALLVSTAADLGGQFMDAISYCNVLFVGNLCAAVVVLLTFGPRRIGTALRSMDTGLWIRAIGFAALSAMLSTLIFMALETTSVTNVVLLARLGPVLYVLLGAAVLGILITRSEWLGFGLIAVGVLATVFVGNDFAVSKGDLQVLASAGVYALVTLLSKRLLPELGMPALVFVRNLFSAIVFFIFAQMFFGPDHFAEAFYGPLWGIMVVYALVVIVAAQLAWYRAIGDLTPATVARWTVLTPALAVGYAFFINGEHPSATQLVALGFITLGIVVSNLGKRTPKGASESTENGVSAS